MFRSVYTGNSRFLAQKTNIFDLKIHILTPKKPIWVILQVTIRLNMSNIDQPVYAASGGLSGNSSDIIGRANGNGAGDVIECALNELNPYPLDSTHYFLRPDGEKVDAIDMATEGTRVIFQCLDAKSKTAERECLGDGVWSAQSHAIRCDPRRYWIAVIAAATSAFIIGTRVRTVKCHLEPSLFLKSSRYVIPIPSLFLSGI